MTALHSACLVTLTLVPCEGETLVLYVLQETDSMVDTMSSSTMKPFDGGSKTPPELIVSRPERYMAWFNP